MKLIDIKDLHAQPKADENYHLVGWVVNNRNSGRNLGFLSIYDGSCFANLQVVYKSDRTLNFEDAKNLPIGSAVFVSGVLKLTPGNHQPFELEANKIEVLAKCEEYPLQKKEHSLEFLRSIAHIRHRSKFHRAVQLVRKELNMAIFDFFHGLNFMWLHSPIFTTSDTEGAGEAFEIKADEFNQEYFRKPASLTVSGQLHAEAFAAGFRKVFTFGPTFRAEKSHTNRHLAEFWMLEAEVAFATFDDNLALIENMTKHLLNHVLENCHEELLYLEKYTNKSNLISRIKACVHEPFARISYTEAVDILLRDQNGSEKKVQFEFNDIHFGMDLKTEHERYLTEQVFKKPVFIYNYPKDIKAFYMLLNDDNTTVAAADLIMPDIGELVGSSSRESRYDVLKKRCFELNIPTESLQWYLDLRKWGYHSSAGFGLGFDRLIMFICGLDNIRDSVP